MLVVIKDRIKRQASSTTRTSDSVVVCQPDCAYSDGTEWVKLFLTKHYTLTPPRITCKVGSDTNETFIQMRSQPWHFSKQILPF